MISLTPSNQFALVHNTAPLTVEQYTEERSVLLHVLRRMGDELAAVKQQTEQQAQRAQEQTAQIEVWRAQSNALREELASLSSRSKEAQTLRFEELLRRRNEIDTLLEAKEEKKNSDARIAAVVATAGLCTLMGPTTAYIYPVIKSMAFGVTTWDLDLNNPLWDDKRRVQAELSTVARELHKEIPSPSHHRAGSTLADICL